MNNVAIIGLGSMGKRRIRLIKQIDNKINIIGVDSNAERRKEAEEKFGIQTVSDIEEVNSVLCAFVCTPPLTHSNIIKICLSRGFHVFTELNLVDDLYDENIKLSKDKGLILFLSSTFLYRDEIQYIAKEVKNAVGKVNYSYHVGQYLPDWHPWENYRNFFVGNKRSNGCREIMAIELPWLTMAFGDVKKCHVISEKMSGLDIDYPDCYMIQIEHSSGIKGMLTVDVVSRKAVRNLEIFGENIYLSWDGSPSGLCKYNIHKGKNENISLYSEIDKQDGYSAFVIENAYKKEIEHFFRQIENTTSAIYDFEDDRKILKLIDFIEGI